MIKIDNSKAVEAVIRHFFPTFFYKILKDAYEREVINFSVLGLPEAGKSEFIQNIRKEGPAEQTRREGNTVSKKTIKIAGKILIYEEGRDISGTMLNEYPELCKKGDIIYFIFRSKDFLENSALPKDSCEDYIKTYQDQVVAYLGSVIGDKNAQKKPIQIIASFKDQLPKAYSGKSDVFITNQIHKILKNKGLDVTRNCKFYIADLRDREWIERNALELIFNQKNKKL